MRLITADDHNDYYFLGFNDGVGCGEIQVEIPIYRFKFMKSHSIHFLLFRSSTNTLVSHKSHGTRRR